MFEVCDDLPLDVRRLPYVWDVIDYDATSVSIEEIQELRSLVNNGSTTLSVDNREKFYTYLADSRSHSAGVPSIFMAYLLSLTNSDRRSRGVRETSQEFHEYLRKLDLDLLATLYAKTRPQGNREALQTMSLAIAIGAVSTNSVSSTIAKILSVNPNAKVLPVIARALNVALNRRFPIDEIFTMYQTYGMDIHEIPMLAIRLCNEEALTFASQNMVIDLVDIVSAINNVKSHNCKKQIKLILSVSNKSTEETINSIYENIALGESSQYKDFAHLLFRVASSHHKTLDFKLDFGKLSSSLRDHAEEYFNENV